MEKTASRKITIAEMAPHVHSFLPNENKVEKLSKWLIDWLVLSLECGKISPYDLLPSKGDLACHIGVSQGTMQNVFRIVEDAGYLESKQRIGTYVKDRQVVESLEKLTSKREITIEIIKRFILDNGYSVGERLVSIRKIATYTGIPFATVRLAVNCLVEQNILSKEGKNYIIKDLSYNVEGIVLKTLVEKVADGIKSYIQTSLKSGDKLPSNEKLSKRFKVSIKTIHDAVKLLAKEGIVYTRRGRYGTIVTLDSENKNFSQMYSYEKIENKIRLYIIQNCKVGDKLPSIRYFAQLYSTSEKTVKKALDNLASEDFLTFARGRWGGTFVLDIPQNSGEAYKWLAISSDYVENMNN